jgi:hypothetical protein
MVLRRIILPRTGPIRITLPISVAFDLEKFERALANVSHLVERRNRQSEFHGEFMPGCEFVVDPASLEVREAAYRR